MSYSDVTHNEPLVHGDHHGVGHVAPLWVLAGVWITLMVLTYITVAVTQYDLGEFNLYIAMAIATVKAALVVFFFMHLFWDRPFNAVVFIISLAGVALFISGAMIDTLEYRPQIIETYQPAIDAAATGTEATPQAATGTAAEQADTGAEASRSVLPSPVPANSESH